MASVSPLAMETVLDVEDEKTLEPVPMFVKTNENKPEDIDDEIVPTRKMTIADGLRPLLASMKLFGLYFDLRSEDAGDDREAKSRKWNAYIIYAVVIVILLWINAVRMFSAFSEEDRFGLVLFNKLIALTWSIQCAVSQIAFYAASFSGRLEVVFRQQLDDSCARKAQKFATVFAILSWSFIISGSAFFVYGLFFADDLMNMMLASFQIHIILSNPLIPRIIVNFIIVYLISAYIFSQTMTFVLSMIFSKEFKKVMNTMGCCLDSEHRQVSDLDIETFRQKHQEISMTVSHVDDCLMFSTASAFCCQLLCFIMLLYMLIFYHSLMTGPVVIASYVFWMFAVSFGLMLTAAGGISVHHYVSILRVSLITYATEVLFSLLSVCLFVCLLARE